MTSTITLTTVGDDNSCTRVNVAGSAAADGNGIGISGSNTLFNAAAVTDTRSLGGTFTSTGLKNGALNLAVTTAENGGTGLAGEGSYASLSLAYSATVVSQRVVTANSDLIRFDRVMVGSPVSTSITLSTLGDDNNRTRVNVAGTAGTDGNGIAISGSNTLFNAANIIDSRTVGGTFSSPGIASGRLSLSVTTAENGGAGLAGESPYVDLYVWYSATALVNRLVTSTSADLGSVHVGAVISDPITLSTASGDDNHATRSASAMPVRMLTASASAAAATPSSTTTR